MGIGIRQPINITLKVMAYEARAYGLPNAPRQVCENSNISSSSWTTHDSSYIDSLAEGIAGNDCNRYFVDYSNNPQCYNTGNGSTDNSKRCFGAGVSCNNHIIIYNIEIYPRE